RLAPRSRLLRRGARPAARHPARGGGGHAAAGPFRLARGRHRGRPPLLGHRVVTQALSGRRSSDRDGRGVSGRRPVVFFFAYANDRDDKARYLRNLPKEQRRVREAIAPAIEAGLCEVVERNNAGVDDVFDMLQDSRYRDRVAIFHYGGHAGPAELMLETP